MPRVSFDNQQGSVPTQPVSGENNGSIYRGQNMIPRGARGRLYWEVWGGIGSLSEAVADTTLTGTVTTTANDTAIVGSGTKFTRDLIPGQLTTINGRPVSIRAIADDTHAAASQPCPAAAAGAGQTIKAAHTLLDADIYRASLARGNVLRTVKGNILFVGQGIVRLNGVVLDGSPEATPQLKVSLLNPFNGAYTTYKMGMKTPVLTTVVGVAGGTKNMQDGTYSIMIVPARVATEGHNNPSEAIEVAITVGQKIRVTFPAMDAAAGQDAWRVYGTLRSQNQGITGPWYFIDTITTTQVAAAGGTYDFEYRDAEIKVNEIVEFDNDPPPSAAFVGQLGNYPVLISTDGAGTVLQGTVAVTNGSAVITGTGTAFDVYVTVGSFVYVDNAGVILLFQVKTVDSATQITAELPSNATASGKQIRLGDSAPGPVIRPCKPSVNGVNIEAYPASFAQAVNPPETIIGWVLGLGRLYLMTENRLHIATLSNNLPPVTVRPFWHVGFRNAQSCVFVNGQLFAFTSNGMTRSVEDGDTGSEQHIFAAPVKDVTRSWASEFVRVAYDEVNNAVCFCYSPPDADASGHYDTNILMFMLDTEKWSTLIVVSSTEANRTVTGVANISGKMYLLLSGQTYGWDSGGTNIPWSLLWPGYDAGLDGVDKTVTGAWGKFHTNGGALAISGSKVGEDIALDLPIAGTAKSLPNSTKLQAVGYQKYHVKELQLFCPLITGTWPGTGVKARVDKITLEYEVSPIRH